MKNSIEIPHSLIPVLSESNRKINSLSFYHHLAQNFSFPMAAFGASEVRILCQKTGWSRKTIYNRLNQLKRAKVIQFKHKVELLHSDLFLELLLPKYQKTPFVSIVYSPMLLELKIKALPLYLNYLKQTYWIESRIKQKLGKEYSIASSLLLKQSQLEILKARPYKSSEIKTVPILTHKHTSELLRRRSSNSAFRLLNKLGKAGLITMHKMPKAQIKNRQGRSRSALEEPPTIIFFNQM